MPTTTIPLADTETIAEQDNPFDLTNPIDFNDPIPFHPSDVITMALRPTTIAAQGDDPEYLAGDMTVTYDMLANAIGRQFGRILQWTPNTSYYGPTTYRGLLLPGDTVKHSTGVYDVIQDFQSDATFIERISDDLVMSRLTRDTDSQYLEIIGSANAPITVGSAVLRYTTIRQFNIFKEYNLPNSRLNPGLEFFHKAFCNADITTDLVLTIKRVISGGESIIGDITFTPFGIPSDVHWVEGIMTFNDPSTGPEATTRLIISRGEMLVIEATTVPAELTFISLNLLGVFINYQSPFYNMSE